MSETYEVQSIPDVPIRYRLIEPTDLPFVIDSWMKSYRKREVRQGVEPTHYQEGQLALITYLAKVTKIVVACDASEPLYIVGWACANVSPKGMFKCHYVYVKEDYRRHGIGWELLNRLGYRKGRPMVCSHWTKVAREHNLRHHTLLYNPYLITLGAQYV